MNSSARRVAVLGGVRGGSGIRAVLTGEGDPQVEVAAVLQNGAGGDLADSLAFKPEVLCAAGGLGVVAMMEAA